MNTILVFPFNYCICPDEDGGFYKGMLSFYLSFVRIVLSEAI